MRPETVPAGKTKNAVIASNRRSVSNNRKLRRTREFAKQNGTAAGERQNADKVFKGVAYACGILILVVLAAVALFLLFRAWPLIGGDQQANSDTISNFTGGKASSFWAMSDRCCSAPC